jgi:hypothetical protein
MMGAVASFEMHERAFAAVRGPAGQPLPSNILWKVERRLNDPDCKDPSTPTSRLGWASQTVDFTCYDRDARPRHYMATCDRQYSWGTAKEDYILPDAHTVVMHIAPEHLAAGGAGRTAMRTRALVITTLFVAFQSGTGIAVSHAADLKARTLRLDAGVAPARRACHVHTQSPGPARKQACKDKLVIKRVPFSLNRALSGVSVKVALPNGTALAEPNVTVEDVFVVAMGDSFASGESNPDRPVTFSAGREMVYDPVNTYQRDRMATRARDRHRHRLQADHRSRRRIRQARRLCARSPEGPGRPGQHGHAPHVPGGRQFSALFAGGRVALRPPLASRPQSE